MEAVPPPPYVAQFAPIQLPSAPSAYAASAPAYKLYDSPAVLIATLFGGPIAGCTVAALNYRRLGRNSAAALCVVSGFALFAVAFAIGSVTSKFGTAIGFGLTVGTWRGLASMQQTAVSQHRDLGGWFESRWKAFGIGMATLVIIFAAIFGWVLLDTATKTKVQVGPSGTIFYADGATQADAEALGGALKTDMNFGDHEMTAFLSRKGGKTILSFVVRDGFWDDPDHVKAFAAITRDVAPKIGGLPVTMRLLNSDTDVKKEVVVTATQP